MSCCVSEKGEKREGHLRETCALNHPILFDEPDFSTKIQFKIFPKAILKKLFEKFLKNPLQNDLQNMYYITWNNV